MSHAPPIIVAAPTTISTTVTAVPTDTATVRPAAVLPSPVVASPPVTATLHPKAGDTSTAELGPPGTKVLDDQEDYTLAQGPSSLEETEAYFVVRMHEMGAHLLEQLWTPENQYGGESFFLLFWRQDQTEDALPQASCVHGFTDDTPTVYVMRGDCRVVRSFAESIRRVAWSRPETIEWVSWQADEISFVYPAHWQPDETFFTQPYCRTEATDCLLAVKDESEIALASLSIVRQPRVEKMTSLDYGQALYNQLQQDSLGYTLLAILPIRLESGQEVIQDIYLYRTLADTTAVQFSVHAVTATDYYLTTGNVIVRSGELSALYAVVSAMARSVQLEEE